MELQNKIHFYINSSSRNSGTDSDFTITLPSFINTANVDRVVVLQASIPKTYYLTNSTSTFTLIENNISSEVLLTKGNFNIDELAVMIANALNLYSPNVFTYSVNFNKNQGTFTYVVTNNNNIQPIIYCGQVYSILGFNNGSQVQFINNTLISSNIINANKESTLFLHSDICENNGNNILQEIYTVENIANSYISWINPNPAAYSKQFKVSSNPHFWLSDEFGNILDLNGINLNLTLLFYKSNEIDYLKKFIKLITYKLHLESSE